MKRAEQLQDLSREHHNSLAMAKRIAEVAKSGSDEELLVAIEKVKGYYETELEIHFQHEEHTIFAPIYKEYKEYIALASVLLKEHGVIRLLIPTLTLENAKEGLANFAKVLKSHTRTEERELFPIIEAMFTEEQLNAVLKFAPLD